MPTPYDVRIAPRAREHILQLAKVDQKTLVKMIEGLAFNPRPPDARRVEGMTGLYVQHIDHLRVVYKVDENEILILLAK